MTKQNKEPKKITSGEETSSYVNFLNIEVEQEKYRKAWPDVMKFVEQYPNVIYDNEFVEVSIDGRKELYFAYTKMIDDYKKEDTRALKSDLTINEILSKVLKYVNFKEDGTCLDVDRKRFERDSRNPSEMRFKLKVRNESIELISDVMVWCYGKFLTAENTFKKVYALVHEKKKIEPSTWLDSAMAFIVKAVNYEPYCYFWNLLQNLQPVLIDRKLSPSETKEEIEKIKERFCGKDDKQGAAKEPGKAEGEEGEEKPNLFRTKGDMWEIRYEGQEAYFPVSGNKGLQYLHYVLQRPNKDIPAIEIINLGKETTIDQKACHLSKMTNDQLTEHSLVEGGLGDSGKALDKQAKADYQSRLKEIKVELAEAERKGREYDIEELNKEKDFIESELSRAFGLGGKARRNGDHLERARVSVTLRIKKAVDRLNKKLPLLGAHFRDSLTTGASCQYLSNITWEF